ncbi:MAG TPA: hypothetical protein VEC39_14670 [Vicinamibacterales bacterium]|nr:hypothetical protein [Vicinamibacterales bacterium]
MFDAHKNFAYSTVATAPTPPNSGTSLDVQAGHGTRFPATPFNATVWPANTIPDPSNAEIVRVTGITADAFAIVRQTESSGARSIQVGDQIAASITNKVITDIEAGINFPNLQSAGYVKAAGAIGLTSGQKIYLDGVGLSGDTYLYESAANVYSVVVGGTERFKIDGNGIVHLLGRERLVVASDINLSADANNYNPTGFSNCNFLLVTPTGADRSITGMAAGADGDVVYLSNQSTTRSLTLVYESSSSTSVNRFTTPGSTNAVLTPLKTAMLYYGANRWNVAVFS